MRKCSIGQECLELNSCFGEGTWGCRPDLRSPCIHPVPGAVLTHGCLHAPAHALHLPRARGHLGHLLSEQPAVCTGSPPAGFPLPVAARLLLE